MGCDHCDAIFTTFHDARRHYKEMHDDKKGYIKCVKHFHFNRQTKNSNIDSYS